MTNKSITLNVWKNNNKFAMAVQGEVDSRFLSIKLEDENGPIDLTSKSVIFVAKKPDGNVIFNSMIIDDAKNGIAILELTSQMSAFPGTLENCEVHVMSENGETLIAQKINIFIQPSLGISTEESISELTAFQKIVSDVNILKQHSASENNPHNVTATQVGALLDSTKYGSSLEVNGTTLSLKDQDGDTLNTVITHDTTYSVATKNSDGLMSSSDKTKLDGIENGANSNVQSDWNQTNTSSDDYIKNKPSIPSEINDLSGTLPISKGGTGAVNLVDAQKNLQYYNSYSQLGLTSGCSTSDIINALPSYSIFSSSVNTAAQISDAPAEWGQITIIKSRDRKILLFNQSLSNGHNGNNFYFGEHCSTYVTWYKIFTANPNCVVPISNGGTGATTAAAALTNLGAQAVTDNALNTTDKTIVGAINEIYNMISGS